MQFSATFPVFVTILQFVCVVYTAKDATLEPKTSGRDVVNAVLLKLTRTAIFPVDRRFLVRIAYVESKFGVDANTYRFGYFGGIWQVDKVGFEDTQNTGTYPGLRAKIQLIERHFGIKWMEVKWEDLLKPLYSGLAARLFLSNVDDAIPETIQGQATYWKTHYNKNGAGTVAKFISDIRELEGSSVCNAKIDITVALDGSGSIYPDDFSTAKNGVAQLLTRFLLETTKFAYIVFGDRATIIFSLDTKFGSSAELESKIVSATQPKGGTRTDLAIDNAVKMLTANSDDKTHGKVLTVFTDGRSTYDSLTKIAANNAVQAEITTFAIGIGNDVDPAELLVIAGNKSNHVFDVKAFATIVELAYSLNSEACSVPQKPSLNETVTDTVAKDETHYFTFSISVQGITIIIDSVAGQTGTYYSFSVGTPSSAWNDGEFSGKGNVFIPASKSKDESSKQVYVAVQGLETKNTFTIKALEGNHSGSAGIGVSVTMLIACIYAIFQNMQ